MRAQFHLWMAIILLSACRLGGAVELGVLVPVMQDKAPLTRAAPSGAAAPVLTRVRQGTLFAALQNEAAHGFTAHMLAIDALAMRLAGQGRTTWLMLAMDDGGYARRGFWLREGKSERWFDEPLVDLVVDADSIADGSFEEIFAHELGHVLLRRLLPTLPAGYSRTPHHSFSITDQQTAFDEGFATHFQAISRLYTRNARLRAQDMGVEVKPYTPLWLSNLDRAARIDGVRQNWFVHQQVVAPGVGQDQDDPIARRELSTLFDRERLKNAPQMLASEGVVATVFYHQLAAGGAPLAPRYEALLRALQQMNRLGLTPSSALLPTLAQTLLRESPDAGRRFVATLTQTTYGALGAPTLAAAAEALGRSGRIEDGDAFVPALQTARSALAARVAALQAQPERLADGAGPALWLLHPTRKAGNANDAPPLAIDLNTAEKEHLLCLPGIDPASAERALASRRSGGNFRDLDDFAARAGLTPEHLAALAAMARKLAQAGTYSRQ